MIRFHAASPIRALRRRLVLFLESHSPADSRILNLLYGVRRSIQRQRKASITMAVDLRPTAIVNDMDHRSMLLGLAVELSAIFPTLRVKLLTTNRIHQDVADLKIRGVDLVSVDEFRTPRLSAVTDVDAVLCSAASQIDVGTTSPIILYLWDLAILESPHLFPAAELQQRLSSLRHCLATASKIVCASEPVRETLLRLTALKSERVVTIPFRAFGGKSSETRKSWIDVCARYQLVRRRFFFFPGEYVQANNHKMLFLAFQEFLARNPNSDMKLVCVGREAGYSKHLRECVIRMGIGKSTLIVGDSDEILLESFLAECAAVIIPSLTVRSPALMSGFFSANRPVLYATALKGAAASVPSFSFDPRKPYAITDALESVTREYTISADAADFEKTDEVTMSMQYVTLVQDILFQPFSGSWKEWIKGWKSKVQMQVEDWK